MTEWEWNPTRLELIVTAVAIVGGSWTLVTLLLWMFGVVRISWS